MTIVFPMIMDWFNMVLLRFLTFAINMFVMYLDQVSAPALMHSPGFNEYHGKGG